VYVLIYSSQFIVLAVNGFSRWDLGLIVDILSRLLCMQDVRSIVVGVDEDATYAVFVCAMSRYGTGRIASLRFSTPRLNPPVATPPSMLSLSSCILLKMYFIVYNTTVSIQPIFIIFALTTVIKGAILKKTQCAFGNT